MKTKAKKPTHVIKFWRSVSREWYWRVIHRNGNVIADGAEGYKRKIDARRAVSRFLAAVKAGTVRADG